MTTCRAASDDKISIMTTLNFLWPDIMQSPSYNTITFLRNTQNRSPISSPWGSGIKLSHLGWGLLSQIPPFRYFPNFSALSKHMLVIQYHIHIWQVSPVRYECDSKNVTCIFPIPKILLMVKSTNGALVTPTPELSDTCPNSVVGLHGIPCFIEPYYRADSRLASSQWETSLQSNTISHWLDANLESALIL